MWYRRELTYCSNVHPGASLNEVSANVKNWIRPVARKRELARMAAGLWLPARAVDSLSHAGSGVLDDAFFDNSQNEHVELLTLNGFPYGDFHQPIVKTKVYQPGWDEEERFHYTLTLAHILSRSLMPGVKTGTISTLPLGYKKNWSDAKQRTATRYLCELAKNLSEIENKTGSRIIICLEMEPDCVLERTHELIEFFRTDLRLAAKKSPVSYEQVLRYIGCCYDICHQAVMFEDIYTSMEAIYDADIVVGKIQISNSPSFVINNDADIVALCELFEEPKFLHQIKIALSDETIHSFSDLQQEDIALAVKHDINLLGKEWRIHFHVPIHLPVLDVPLSTSSSIATTQNAIVDGLRFLRDNPELHPTLEVETYTWMQFKKNLARFDLIQALCDELAWLELEMERFGLLIDPLPVSEQ